MLNRDSQNVDLTKLNNSKCVYILLTRKKGETKQLIRNKQLISKRNVIVDTKCARFTQDKAVFKCYYESI